MLYNIIVLGLSIIFYILYDHVTMIVIVICNVMLILNPKFKNEKINRKKKRENKNRVSWILTNIFYQSLLI